MTKLTRLLLTILWGVILAGSWVRFSFAAEPSPSHALAMYGEPQYGPHFQSFNYVNPRAPKGGTLRLAAIGSFDNLNPFTVKGRLAEGMGGSSGWNLMYSSLMTRSWDEPFTLYGLIAESVTVAPDRSWIIFKLRPQARWEDGKPVTPVDILFSWNTLRAKGKPNHRAYYNRVEKAQEIDPRRVKFTFKPLADYTFDREMPLIMGLMPILPEHIWKSRSIESTSLEPLVGSGPYHMAEVKPGHSVTYTRIKDWWGNHVPAMRGQYNFDTIRFDYYRDDAVALEAFKAHAYDLRREQNATKWFTGYDSPALQEKRMVKEVISHGRPEWMRALVFNTRRPLFQDRRVRMALNEAFDFEWMNRHFFHNLFQRTNSYYPNSELAAAGPPPLDEIRILAPYRKDLPEDVFTRAYESPKTKGDGPASLRPHLLKARTLLQKSGWRLQKGRLVNSKGAPFIFQILVNDPSDERVALAFARTLERLGIEATVRTLDSSQYQARLNNFDFDMTVNKWISTLSPGSEQITFWGSDYADQPGSRNYAGIRNPAIDTLALSLTKATTRADLINHVRALDRALLWGYYVIPLYYTSGDRVAYWTPLRHPAVIPLYGLIIETWWMDQNMLDSSKKNILKDEP